MESVRLTLIIILTGLFSCRIRPPQYTSATPTCLQYIASVPDSVYCLPNIDSSFYLCQDNMLHKSQTVIPDGINSIFIIRCRDGAMILKENIRGGTAGWVDSENIKIFYPSGIPREAAATTYYFNVVSGKKSRADSKSK